MGSNPTASARTLGNMRASGPFCFLPTQAPTHAFWTADEWSTIVWHARNVRDPQPVLGSHRGKLGQEKRRAAP